MLIPYGHTPTCLLRDIRRMLIVRFDWLYIRLLSLFLFFIIFAYFRCFICQFHAYDISAAFHATRRLADVYVVCWIDAVIDADYRFDTFSA